MAGSTHRTKVDGLWVFQLAIPADCREELARRFPEEYRGQKVIRRSLGTGNAREAEVKVREHLDKWRSRIDAIRGPRNPEKLTPLQLAAVEELRSLGYHISLDSEPDHEGAVPAPPAESARTFRELERGFAERRYAYAHGKMVEKLAAAGLDLDPDVALEGERQRIAARLDAVERAASVVAGDVAVNRPSAFATMDTLFERWKREARPTVSSIQECEFSVRRWREMHGSVAVDRITKPMVRAFRDAMLSFPTRLSNGEAALPLQTILDKYQDKDVPRASIASARKRLSFIKTLLSTAVDTGLIPESPAEGVRIKDDGAKPGQERRAFTVAELKIITDRLADQDESFRWVTLLGIYTGCRLGELVQLEAADARVEDGVTFIDINAAGGKSIKTGSSIRRVPLHPDIRNAFLAFVEGKKGRLFPDIRPGTNGDITDLISKRFNYWRKRVGLTGQGLCFHSLRHSFKDRCREAGIAEEVHDALTGHAGGGVGRRYGGRPPLKVLAEAVAKLQFPNELLQEHVEVNRSKSKTS
ncbi:site-specific integrase [Azospirillum thermophilum]|uniref:Tyr recombinase domain-containing protein n=1 Tax=Azospirillum thermophilum TaxID=2202148 RepID=A0A2S2CLH1_9PROT|nr:site-specific integrase [Azospirillum thermophilum]AWK85344.1 hypothetical protein DEW08_03380 [Azospirillum thermophilum]